MTGVYQPDRGEILLAGKPIAIAQRRRGAAPRHRRDLPGAAALPRPQRRREHLHQPPGPRPGRQLAPDVPRGRGDPRRPRRRARRAQPGARADARRPAVGRDRQGDLAQRPRPHHGRADRVALGARGRASSSSWSSDLRDQGVAILFVSHRMEEVFEIADKVTVFRDGRLISTRPRAEVTPRTRHRRHGRPRDRACCSRGRRSPQGELAALGPRASAARASSDDVNFDVHRGEVLGFAGLIGAGRTDVGLALFGIEPATVGDDRPRRQDAHHPLAARRRWRSASPTVSEDRRQLGLSLPMSIAANISLPVLQALSQPLRPRSARRWSGPPPRPSASGLSIRTPSVDLAGRQALRRQPAEGDAEQVAEHAARRCSSSTSRRAASTSAPRPRCMP